MAMHAAGRSGAHALDGDDASGTTFHFGFDGSAFMVPSLRITSWSTFIAACLITSAICLSERYLTYLISTKWTPFRRGSPIAVSLCRSAMYWVVTLERLIYMLIAMTFHAGLILAIVTALSIGQFFIELQEAKSSAGSSESYYPLRNSVDIDNEPYTDPPTSLFPFTPAPRSAQPEAAQFRIPASGGTSNASQSSLLTPGYRAPPRRAVAFEVPDNTDVGSGNGRERAREIMGGGR